MKMVVPSPALQFLKENRSEELLSVALLEWGVDTLENATVSLLQLLQCFFIGKKRRIQHTKIRLLLLVKSLFTERTNSFGN